jgi:nucleoside-diphosphate kinase
MKRFFSNFVRLKISFIMPGRITFTMIKPDAVENNYTGPILARINEAGFHVTAMRFTKLSPEKAGEFYAIHKERPFFNDLVKYMSSGPIVAAILEKDNAVDDFRKLIGATDPAKAAKGTIRNLFAKSIDANAIHGSDSDANAEIEGNFFFARTERF